MSDVTNKTGERMKKIILSAAVAAMAFSTSAVAADKGIDIVTTGQAVVYYQTSDSNKAANKSSLASSDNSSANVGLQLNLAADLQNNFTFGSQLTYVGGAGLDRTVVDANMQTNTQSANTTDNIALTKIFVAKKIANTTFKLGRQELPKSLSPLAFTEGWNVFKNTFDAILAINSDIPKTTLVGAYVTSTTNSDDLTTVGDMTAKSNLNDVTGAGNNDMAIDGNAYMITAQNTALPMTTVTASYYSIKNVTSGVNNNDMSANAMWLNVAVADKSLPMGLKMGLQAGNLDPKVESSATAAALVGLGDSVSDTNAFGLKASIVPMPALTLTGIYTSVDGGENNEVNLQVRNVGGVKSPMYSQMVGNQTQISLANDTLVLKGSYNMGDMGSVTLAYGMTDDTSYNAAGTADDYNELDLVYKVKSGGVSYLAAYVNQDFKGLNTAVNATDSNYTNHIVRLWARLNF